MPETNFTRLTYNRVRAFLCCIALMIPVVLVKSHNAGVQNLALLLPYIFLFLIWMAYKLCYLAMVELPDKPANSHRSLPDSMFLLAFLGGGSIIVGLSAGFTLGRAVGH